MIRILKSRPHEIKGMKPTIITKDSGYLYTTYELYDLGESFVLSANGSVVNKKWVCVHKYRQYGAYQLLELLDPADGELHARHLEDLILKFYNSKNLSFYKNSFFKDLLLK